MHPNAALGERFYTAFQRRDAAGMIACYHPQIEFSDPVFPDLRGDQARAMWKMLAGRAQDLELTFSDVTADDRRGSARWIAKYTFSKTGRKVINRISAEFEFTDGLISRHRDRFDLWKWAGMALGAKGMLLGWTPLVQNAIRAEAARGLARFQG